LEVSSGASLAPGILPAASIEQKGNHGRRFHITTIVLETQDKQHSSHVFVLLLFSCDGGGCGIGGVGGWCGEGTSNGCGGRMPGASDAPDETSNDAAQILFI
jgi:hypothetical protein